MSTDINNIPINFQNIILPTVGMLIAGVACIYFNDYWWSFIFIMAAIVTMLYRLCALTFVQTTVQRYVAYVIYLLIFIAIFFLANRVGEYFNQRALIQQQCGSVQNIKINDARPSMSSFDLVNHQQQTQFQYQKHQAEIEQYAHKICVSYSFDQNWAKYPYIHQIKAHD